MKQRAAQEVGIGFRHCALPAEATAEALIETVKSLNADENVSGILVQLPLGENILPEQEREVTEAISPGKDVDGYVLSFIKEQRYLDIRFPDFTPTTSAIWCRVLLTHYLRHAHQQAASRSSTQRTSKFQGP